MTSRELTSGFDFWSRGHLRMAVMQLHIKFDADIFIQSGVIDIYPLGGFPSEYRHTLWYGKTRMVSLPDGEKISKICLFVLT